MGGRGPGHVGAPCELRLVLSLDVRRAPEHRRRRLGEALRPPPPVARCPFSKGLSAQGQSHPISDIHSHKSVQPGCQGTASARWLTRTGGTAAAGLEVPLAACAARISRGRLSPPRTAWEVAESLESSPSQAGGGGRKGEL